MIAIVQSMTLSFFCEWCGDDRDLHSFPTRRSSDLPPPAPGRPRSHSARARHAHAMDSVSSILSSSRSEEHTSELQSRQYLVCRLLLEKNKSFLDPLPMLLSQTLSILCCTPRL